MYKTTVIPTNSQILIPDYYIGKQIEVLVYTVDEITNESKLSETIRKKPSDFIGCISKKTAKKMLQDIDKSRSEWSRDI